jgi:hypothetical protein
MGHGAQNRAIYSRIFCLLTSALCPLVSGCELWVAGSELRGASYGIAKLKAERGIAVSESTTYQLTKKLTNQENQPNLSNYSA